MSPIKARQRVALYGEVFTPGWLVRDMLDLVPAISRPDTRVFAPACGEGAFLAETLRRKLAYADSWAAQEQHLHAIHALRSLYGVDLLEDNVAGCRETLLRIVAAWLDLSPSTGLYGEAARILSEQVVCADLLLNDPPFSVQFDVIVGNPPYQRKDGGLGSTPIFQHFVEQARRLAPRYILMVIPSRWMGGGKGLTRFRASMLNDKRLRKIVDFEDAKQVFPEVDISGGVCYFLRDKEFYGPCEVTTVTRAAQTTAWRQLNEFDVFVRHTGALPIVRKVRRAHEDTFDEQVSSRKPFGLTTAARPTDSGELTLYWRGGSGPYPATGITAGRALVPKWKVVTSFACAEHAGTVGADGKRKVFSRIMVLPPNSVCTETYLVIGAYNTQAYADRLVAYMRTKFFRFLLAQSIYSQHITKSAYRFVPILAMDRTWTDEMLARRYGLTEAEVAFIEERIR